MDSVSAIGFGNWRWWLDLIGGKQRHWAGLSLKDEGNSSSNYNSRNIFYNEAMEIMYLYFFRKKILHSQGKLRSFDNKKCFLSI